MKYLFCLQEPSFTVENIDIQKVSRPKNYRHSFRSGRTKHGFIYTVSGRMLDLFHARERESITVGAGEMIFIPKGESYTGVYLEDNTEIKIVQFDIASGDKIGTLSDVLNLGASDLYEIKTDNGKKLIPAVDEFIKEIDLDRGIFVSLIEGMLD